MSVHTELFEDSISYLKKADTNGQNLYDHLSETLLRILEERPSDPVDKFEFLSTEVKRGAYTADAPHTSANVLQDNSPAVTWASDANKLFEKVEAPEGGADETSVNTAFELEDCMSQAAMLEWAGASVGQEELYRLMLSMQKKCSQTMTIKSARFWGKILGKQSDYYIMETTRVPTEGGDDSEADPNAPEVPVEKDGEGCNFFVYYVCTFAGGEWTQLPNVEPEQIRASRYLRKFFTGNLDAKVRGYPPFPGGDAATEKNLLRAQIARISSSTAIAPKGFYTKGSTEDEDADPDAPAAPEDKPLVELNKKFGVVDEESESEPLTAKAMLDGENWEHTFPFILPMGRCVAPPKKNAGDEEEEEADPDAEDNTEKSNKFTSTKEGDSLNVEGYPKGTPAWNFAMCSNLTPTHAPVVARSLMWPGAISVFLGTKSCNFYCGYGVKHLSGMEYTPEPPTDIQTEFNHRPVVKPADGDEADESAEPKTESIALEKEDPAWEEEEKEREAREQAEQDKIAAANAEEEES